MKIKIALLAGLIAVAPFAGASAQSMIDMVDLKSDAFTMAEMSRADIEAAIAKLGPGEVLDLRAKALNGLDLSNMDLRRTNLQTARLMGTNLAGANLDGVVLDQAWALNADLTGASLKGASLFGTQLVGAKLDNADLSNARVAGNFSKASLVNARFDGADLSPDETNQSMGLMRGEFSSAKLDGASFWSMRLCGTPFSLAQISGASSLLVPT